MRTLLLAGLGVLGWAGMASAAPIFSDDFENGTGKWKNVSISYSFALSTLKAHSPTHSYKSSNLGARVYSNIEGGVEGSWRTSWWIYDDGATNRIYGEFRAYDGGVYAGNIQNLLAIGKYNTNFDGYNGGTVDTTKYQGKVMAQDHPGVDTGNGWFNLSVSKSAGWHQFEIDYDVTTRTARYYVDGVLGATIPSVVTPASGKFCTLMLGHGTSGTGTGYYDDVLVTPDPATLIVLGVGGLLLGRRRAQPRA